MKNQFFKEELQDHLDTFNCINELESEISLAVEMIVNSMKVGGKLMLCGNGGSAADSQHIAAEFTGRFLKDRKPLPAMSLTTDTSALTCISNDYSFEHVFSRQVEALGKKEDILIGISTSGNSINVIKAFEIAKLQGIKTIGFLGNNGGKIKLLSDVSLLISSNVTARIQEAHIFIGHIICQNVEYFLLNSN
jgi:D-sedoheptulose 7-phosphate isomerase